MTMRHLLGLQPSAPAISQYLDSLADIAKVPKPSFPEIKSYTDAVYFNYYSLGISLLFMPMNGYKPQPGLKMDDLRQEDLVLDSIDIYNMPGSKADDADKPKALQSERMFTTFPVSPVVLPIAAQAKDKDGKPIERPLQLIITLGYSGGDFVGTLGEPDRKGGGAGPSSGSINIWCEWSTDGVMVEFGGAQAKGPNAWDMGKDAVWKVITLFRPGTKNE